MFRSRTHRPDPRQIKDLITRTMAARGVSAYRLAQMTGLSQAALSHYFSERNGLQEAHIEKILLILAIDLSAIDNK